MQSSGIMFELSQVYLVRTKSKSLQNKECNKFEQIKAKAEELKHMAKRKKSNIKDIFTLADVGEMVLSFFAILAVLSTPTAVPKGIAGAGIWLAIFSTILIYFAIYALLSSKSDEPKSVILMESVLHLVSAVVVTIIGVIIGGTLYGMIWGQTIDQIINSPLVVAYSAGLIWAGVIDGLKGD